ncbi:oxygen-dependent coproporphyrinogen-III oxidase, mitochondrial-like isoform X2 [Alosa pseudoharengus]|uniref:oxygen-dependent coproporphyrinogen-III oxidase, mitochondrial-like isoform X2 n=1 Tax=Alosa pseudoharengus TaxID=34774 RepID=UPI003F8ABB38
MEAMTEEKILSFFQGCIPTDFSSRTQTQANRILRLFAKVREELLQELQKIEGAEFKLDTWKRAEGGGGIMAVMSEGDVLSKTNVDLSIVTGKIPMAAVKHLHQAAKITTSLDDSRSCYTFTEDHSFLGISFVCIVHAKNPHVPAGHFNLRILVMKLNDGAEVGWYGGVMDINPSYLVPEDATHFHKTLKDMCDKHDASYYPRFKKWCDEYFFIPHRGERRGLGGIFFDNLTSEEEENFSFLESCSNTILPAYLPILKARMCDTYTDQEMVWQQFRNGRYTEFNLMHDKGMKFGLQLSGFRKETLFASLPLTASWGYKSDPEPGSREDELVQVLRCPQEWA